MHGDVPNFRQLRVEEGSFPVKDYTTAMKQYSLFLKKKTVDGFPKEYASAFKIATDDVQRDILEAVLLSGAKASDISTALGIPVEVVNIFEELFFDVSVFQSKLDVISYLARLPKDESKEIKTRAYNMGPEYVYYTYSGMLPSESMQKDLMRRMFMSASYKAMNMHYNSSNSSSAKSSLEFAKLMVKAFESLEKFASAATELNTYLTQEDDFSSMLGYNNNNAHVNDEDIV